MYGYYIKYSRNTQLKKNTTKYDIITPPVAIRWIRFVCFPFLDFDNYYYFRCLDEISDNNKIIVALSRCKWNWREFVIPRHVGNINCRTLVSELTVPRVPHVRSPSAINAVYLEMLTCYHPGTLIGGR